MNSEERARIEREVRARIVSGMRARLGLAWHAAVFGIVMLTVVALNLRYTPNIIWFVWPLAAWTIGLGMHAFAILGAPRLRDSEVDTLVMRELARRGLT